MISSFHGSFFKSMLDYQGSPSSFKRNPGWLQDGLNLDGEAEQIETALLKASRGVQAVKRWQETKQKSHESTNGFWLNQA